MSVQRAYSDEERASIIERVIDGLSAGRTLSEMCREDGMPNRWTIYSWRDADAALAQRIACARDEGYDVIAESCLDIADDGSNDTKIVGEDKREVCNNEWISRSKLRVETRLKLLAKWSPKYADKQLVGSDPANPLPAGFTVNLVGNGNKDG